MIEKITRHMKIMADILGEHLYKANLAFLVQFESALLCILGMAGTIFGKSVQNQNNRLFNPSPQTHCPRDHHYERTTVCTKEYCR